MLIFTEPLKSQFTFLFTQKCCMAFLFLTVIHQQKLFCHHPQCIITLQVSPMSHEAMPQPAQYATIKNALCFSIPALTCYVRIYKMLLLKVGSMLYMRK
jgi:hypothetical protein